MLALVGQWSERSPHFAAKANALCSYHAAFWLYLIDARVTRGFRWAVLS